jgi:hypothetical protein
VQQNIWNGKYMSDLYKVSHSMWGQKAWRLGNCPHH